ncbi:MAG: hypothetical protein ACD_47C00219G0004 [uncultured bacterium]|jgi:hypothetical protein|nr:MAG: hypothetical protein ACD_47C00219G0004 [uncultured bacterium]
MNEKERSELDMMAQRFGLSLSEEEIGRILNGIRKKTIEKYL